MSNQQNQQKQQPTTVAEGITPRAADYGQWYLDVVKRADLAEHSSVRGCMVIKPHGYAIWEKLQRELDERFKATGHVNAYFPLFIPLSFFEKEEEHAAGFAKECAVVTHYRLKALDGKVAVDPESKLEEPLVVRPTSETIIWAQYKNWIQSYRDLPLLINQWANIVRWEMRTRLFLRTAEFLWQEGHTAHATEAEAMMQDGKALPMGTSHYLGQNFAKSSDVKVLNKDGQLEYVHATSWGVSTRLVGALIMTHSDDNGLILPPKLAPIQVVIVPIYKTPDEQARTTAEAQAVAAELRAQGLAVKVDDREGLQPGAKYYEWERKGVPVRIEVGPKDLEKGSLCVVRRFVIEKEGESEQDLRKRKKQFLPRAEAIAGMPARLDALQQELRERALAMREKKTRIIDNLADFESFFKGEGGGFAWVHWAGTHEDEDTMAKRYETSIRCIPFEDQIPAAARGAGTCILTGQPSAQRVLMAKAY
jgi:prolyl-tRNA synthetase